nr:MAG TPA: hypothetical protein [Caudoviricetes sp.]
MFNTHLPHIYSALWTTYHTHKITSQNFNTSLSHLSLTTPHTYRGMGLFYTHYLTKISPSSKVLGAVSAVHRPFKGGVDI